MMTLFDGRCGIRAQSLYRLLVLLLLMAVTGGDAIAARPFERLDDPDCDPGNPYAQPDFIEEPLHDPENPDLPNDSFEPEPNLDPMLPPTCEAVADALKAYLEAVCGAANTSTSSSATDCGCSGSVEGLSFWTSDRLARAVCRYFETYESAREANCSCAQIVGAIEACLGTISVEARRSIQACLGCAISDDDCTELLDSPIFDDGTCEDLLNNLKRLADCRQGRGLPPLTDDEIALRICAYFGSGTTNICASRCLNEFLRDHPAVEAMVHLCFPETTVLYADCADGIDCVYSEQGWVAYSSSCDVNGDSVVDCDDLLALAAGARQCATEVESTEVNYCEIVKRWATQCVSDSGGACIACGQTMHCISKLISDLGVDPAVFEDCLSGEGNPCPCTTVGICTCAGELPEGCECKLPADCEHIPCDYNGDGKFDCQDVADLIEAMRACSSDRQVCVECVVLAVCNMMQCEGHDEDRGRMCNQLGACIEWALGQTGSVTPELQKQLACMCSVDLPPLTHCGDVETKSDVSNSPCVTSGTSTGAGVDSSTEVVLENGRTISQSTDLSVELPGDDFHLQRSYYANECIEDLDDGRNPAGKGWWLSVCPFITEDENILKLHGPSAHTVRTYTFTDNDDNDLPERWVTGGAGQQYITTEVLTVNSIAFDVWTLHDPGSGTRVFIKANNMGYPAPDGSLYRTTDEYGRFNQYEYVQPGGGSPRLATVYAGIPAASALSGDTADAAAIIRFNWNMAGTAGDANSITGTIHRVECLRKLGTSGQYAITDSVDYRYMACAEFPSDVGGPGKLVEVTKSKLLNADLAWGSAPVFHRAITQYRYFSGNATATPPLSPLNLSGRTGFLKAVINPEQIEFYAQKRALLFNVGDPQAIISRAAESLLYMKDSALIGITDTNGSTPLRLIDLASTVNAYRGGMGADQDQLIAQFIQNSCGCSGATQGLKHEYFYQPSGATATSVQVIESFYSGAAWVPHRDVITDMEVMSDGLPYVVTEAVIERDASMPATRGRVWATHSEYDYGAGVVQLVRKLSPAAIDYTTSFNSDGSDTMTPPAVSYVENGRLDIFNYTWDNRLAEHSIARVDTTSGTLSYDSGAIIQSTTYGNSDIGMYPAERPWLPVKVERFTTDNMSPSADEIETTEYAYGFYAGGNALAWTVTSVEAETEGENGPNGTGTYVSHTLIGEDGLVRWTHAADNTLTYFEYDIDSPTSISQAGALTKVTRNPTSASPSADWPDMAMDSIDTTGWGRGSDPDSGGELVTQYQLDSSGRVVSQVSPSGVTAYTVRTLRAPISRPILGYYTVMSLPYSFTQDMATVFTGAGSLSFMNAAGKEIESQEREVDPGESYDPIAGDVTFVGGEVLVGRSETTHTLSGLTAQIKTWHSIDRNEAVTNKFIYDDLGRLSRKVEGRQSDGSGAVTEYQEYDVLGRVLKMAIGRDEAGGTTTVAEYFYDDPDPLDAMHGHSQGMGNGNLSVVHAITGEGSSELLCSEFRDTVTLYDWRDRLVEVRNASVPHQVLVYDNLDRVVERGLFSAVPSSGMTHVDRTLYAQTAYSQRGLVYRQRVAIDPSDSTPAFLETHSWFDSEGRVLAAWGPNAPASKREYDAHGRTIRSLVTDRLDDHATGIAGNYHDAIAIALTDDNVLEQVEMTYETGQNTSTHVYATGKLLLTTTRRRYHDFTTPGILDGSNSVATYTGYDYDGADRIVQTVNFGTNATDDIFANGSAPTWPGSPPASAITEEVEYDSRGRLSKSIAPAGTDGSPEHRVTKYLYDDFNRQIAVIENWQSDPTFEWVGTDGGRWSITAGINASYPDQNRVTSYVYNDWGNVRLQVAHLPPEGGTPKVQITEYVYGTTAASASTTTNSLVDAQELLLEVHYPDESTGEPGSGSTYTVAYSYNSLGELRSVVDQNGTAHVYVRDEAGRVTEDQATVAMSSPIDDSTRRIQVTYDASGRVSKVGSYDAVSAGTILNEVEYTYTPLWQIERAFQSPVGAVSRSTITPTNDTRVVTYAYATTAAPASGTFSTGANFSRLTEMTYPELLAAHTNPTLITYTYGSGDVNDRIHRISSLALPSPEGTFASYERIGLGMLAKADIQGFQLDYTIVNQNARFGPTAERPAGLRRGSDTGSFDSLEGVYAGYDRFGRVGTQVWASGSFGPRPYMDANPDRPLTRQFFQENYSYDRASNRLTRDDVREFSTYSDRHENHTYDALDRLSESTRGVRGGSWAPASGSQKWVLDMLGNWVSIRSDLTGDGTYTDSSDVFDVRGATGTTSSGHNLANELTQRIIKNGAGTPTTGTIPLSFDDSGNMKEQTRDDGIQWRYVHDAWNRLVKVEMYNTVPLTPQWDVKATYGYNGMHWRTIETHGSATTRMYYSAAWQLLWEETDDVAASGNGIETGWRADVDKTYANVFGLRGLDDLVLRRVDGRTTSSDGPDGDFAGNAPFDMTYYILSDVQLSSRVVVGGSRQVWERWRYMPYGESTMTSGADYDCDGVADFFDYDAYDFDFSITPPSAPDDRRADLDSDGYVDSFDYDAFNAVFNPDPDTSMPNLRHTYCGYVEDSVVRLQLARFRWYDPRLGRWIQRDPAAYIDGANMFAYGRAQPITGSDTYGLNPDFSASPQCKCSEQSEACVQARDKQAAIKVALGTHCPITGAQYAIDAYIQLAVDGILNRLDDGDVGANAMSPAYGALRSHLRDSMRLALEAEQLEAAGLQTSAQWQRAINCRAQSLAETLRARSMLKPLALQRIAEKLGPLALVVNTVDMLKALHNAHSSDPNNIPLMGRVLSMNEARALKAGATINAALWTGVLMKGSTLARGLKFGIGGVAAVIIGETIAWKINKDADEDVRKEYDEEENGTCGSLRNHLDVMDARVARSCSPTMAQSPSVK